MNINIAGYHFAHLSDLNPMRQALLDCALNAQLKGTILLSTEGINLFVAGTRDNIETLLATIRGYPELADLIVKESLSDDQPFSRMIVKIKKEILSFGIEKASPLYQKPKHVTAKQLKEWLDLGEDIILLDTRNDFEVELGTFENAEHLNIQTFKGLIDTVAMKKSDWENKTVVTFCTGGIRCEKASSYMMSEGFDEVYHLEGGILKYLEEVNPEESLWQGECFVFDQRVAIKHGLEVGQYDQCYACRYPLSADDIKSEKYTPGISCPHCFNTHTPAKLKSLTERQKQVILAKKRGIDHIG